MNEKEIDKRTKELINVLKKKKQQRSMNEVLNDLQNVLTAFVIGYHVKFTKDISKAVDEASENVDKINIALSKPNFSTNTIKKWNYIELGQHLSGLKDEIINEINIDIKKNPDPNITEVKTLIINKLKSEDIFSVTYANGRRINAEIYAKMVARTARLETSNSANIAYALANDTDLVMCIGPHTTCEVCAQYVDRVFSISGDDKRYPSLYETALKEGYKVIHPNCRHDFIPYFENQHTNEENAEKIKYSSRPFEDSRTMRQKETYDKWQAKQRGMWSESLCFREMKDKLGDQMPYINMGSFRKAYRADTESYEYKESHNAVRDFEQFKRWKETLIKDDMPVSLAEFQKMKYNDIDKYNQLSKKYNLKTKIIQNEFPIKIHKGKQGKHLLGDNNYIEGKSVITLSSEDCEMLVKDYYGKGMMVADNKEIVKVNKIVGYVITPRGDKIITDYVKIHYSKTGTHIVPYLLGDKK